MSPVRFRLEQAEFTLAAQGSVNHVAAARVDESFFATLQSTPKFGRVIDASDNQPGHDKVAVISHSLWQSIFAGSADVLARNLVLDGTSYRIVGVMQPEFEYSFSSDLPYGNSQIKSTRIWVPLALTPQQAASRSPGADVTVGYALGGLPGERLLKRLGIKSSDDTVLRRVKTRRREARQVRVLSVDDWAWRKQQRYGTMLMDLERLEVIDLLPVWSADSFAEWLGLHPGVEVITRDRSTLYADGGRRGAPAATQITDRYHLVSNLSEAVEHDVQQLQRATG